MVGQSLSIQFWHRVISISILLMTPSMVEAGGTATESGKASQVGGLLPWPAEPFAQAINLTSIEGPGTNDFFVDLSGAVWNPVTRRLWVCRNGPNAATSKLWAIVRDANGNYQIDSKEGFRGEWTGFGDFEGLTLADSGDTSIFVIIEGEERIKEYDVSTYGTHVLLNDWNTSTCLPGEGGEAITFVPDSYLAAAGFVNKTGSPYVSQGGLGGLFFVGHQELGRIYVFDVVRGNGPNAFTMVGEYATQFGEIAGLEFDLSTGLLYVLHDAGFDAIEVLDLTSLSISGIASCPQAGSLRQFHSVASYSFPGPGNYEGLAITSIGECRDGGRRMFLTIDDGGANSLYLFEHFAPGCEESVPAASTWGLVILVLSMAASATLIVRRRSSIGLSG